MEDFVVSARKYRPQTFDTVVGQESITQTLLKSIENNHLAQAFLFCGPRGVGKTTCARILARVVNERNQDGEHPESDYAFNIFELDAASNNGVDEIRNLIDQVRIPPQVGKYKVYIIDEVHMLSTSAFNAFLKTLEEPPPYAIFIMATTEKHKVLPTILSRCQIFDFNRIQINDIVNHLAKIAVEEGVEVGNDALHIIAEKADGALRDALSIFDQVVGFAGNTVSYEAVIENLNILDYDYYFQMTDLFLSYNRSGTIVLLNTILNKGFDAHNFVSGLANHFRNLLFCTSERTAAIMEVGENIKVKYAEQSKASNPRFILNALNILSDVDAQFKGSKNQRLLVEIALLNICELTRGVSEKKNDQPEQVAESSRPETETKAPPTPEPVLPKPEAYSPPKVEREIAVQESKPEPAKPEQPKPTTPSNTKLETPLKEEVAPPAPKTETSKPAAKKAGIGGKLSGLKSRGLPSLNDIGTQKKKSKFSSDEAAVFDQNSFQEGKPVNEFNMAQLWASWDRYAKSIKEQDKQSYYATLSKHKPILKEDFKVEYLVDNHVQKQDLDHDKANLLEYIREDLQNWKIILDVIIDEEDADDGDSLYEPQKKFEAMAKDNPVLIELKKRFDLDIDYDG